MCVGMCMDDTQILACPWTTDRNKADAETPSRELCAKAGRSKIGRALKGGAFDDLKMLTFLNRGPPKRFIRATARIEVIVPRCGQEAIQFSTLTSSPGLAEAGVNLV
eukprot:TRINITY_DN5740_c0_g1_i3.p5 TRINITY_DN5740_c0_g1~~TRINITY_DN5740_c0_g1_i3.p5  ORF type:complete len:107 (-),score=8.68 TRINITY_DN5740_c0_g1_i3:1615-1935(-)